MDHYIPIYIQVYRDNALHQTNKFSQENVIIGSGPAAHVRLLNDHRVSRIHAMLKVEANGQIKLSDLGWSDEGTLLNGYKISEEMLVNEGDQIQVGYCILQVFRHPPGEQELLSSEPYASNLPKEEDIFPESTEVRSPLTPDSFFPQSQPHADWGVSEPVYNQSPNEPVQDNIFGSDSPISEQQQAIEAHSPYENAPVMEFYEDTPELQPQDAMPQYEETDYPIAVDLEGSLDPAMDILPQFESVAPMTVDYQVPPPPVVEAPAYDDSSELLPPMNVSGAISPLVSEPRTFAESHIIDDQPIPEDQLPAHVRKYMVGERSNQFSLQVRFLWQGTVVDIGHFDKPRVVTVGGHPLNDFNISDISFPDNQNFPLVVPAEGGFGVFFTDQFTGQIEYHDGNIRTIEQLRSSISMRKESGILGYVYALQHNEKLILQSSDLQIEFSFVHPTANYVTAAFRNWDYFYWRVTTISFVAHLALILMFQFFPRGTSALSEQMLQGRFAKLIVVPPPEPPKKQARDFKLKKVEEKTEKKEVVKTADKKKDDAPVDQKTRDQQRVKRSGLLGLLNRGLGDMGPGGNLFGRADQSQQFLGKLLGTSGQGAAFGMGFAGRGFGFGGGGGGGMYGGGGGSFGYGGRDRAYGRGGMNLRGKGGKKSMVRITPGRLILKGALSKEQIARVVQMHWHRIRFCYESQLSANPSLAGKIVVRWVISGTGDVQSATVVETTMNNERVENCIARSIQRWRFPQPEGGGIVVVNYPFLFRVAE